MPERESCSYEVARTECEALRMGYEDFVRRYLKNEFKPPRTEPEYLRWKAKILALRRAEEALRIIINNIGEGTDAGY